MTLILLWITFSLDAPKCKIPMTLDGPFHPVRVAFDEVLRDNADSKSISEFKGMPPGSSHSRERYSIHNMCFALDLLNHNGNLNKEEDEQYKEQFKTYLYMYSGTVQSTEKLQ
ncbi:hypothetical protein U1Q18_034209 [Sarracenia purpurea var. burkii]